MGRNIRVSFVVGIGLLCLADEAAAQRRRPVPPSQESPESASPAAPRAPQGRGGRRGGMGQSPAAGGHGHGSGTRPSPLFAALDKNQDGQISAAELRMAAAVIQQLDANKDGQLSLAECAPARGGHGHGGAAIDPQAEAKENVTTLMAFDKNKDGALTAAELPERLQNIIERADTDSDGKATQAELSAMAQKETSPPAAGRGTGRGRFARPQQ